MNDALMEAAALDPGRIIAYRILGWALLVALLSSLCWVVARAPWPQDEEPGP